MNSNIKIQLSDEQRARLQKAACELDTTPEATAATLIEEGLRMREFPGIHFRDTGVRETGIRRQAFVPGLRLPIYFLAELAREVDNDIDTIAEFYSIPISAVITSLEYIHAFPEEIERNIADYEAAHDELVASLTPDGIVTV